ncbi:MAG TPA: methyl-accepting chemotaxis protein [Ktedonobacteraceae bacterium]|jgi:methyl-accepting chemotaxis protein
MSQGKQQSWSVPLRVRFRPPTDALLWGGPREGQIVSLSPTTDDEPTAPSLPIARQTTTLQQNRQVKELIRLGNILRAELGLNEVLEQIASSINFCIGFRASVIKMIEEGCDNLKAVAFAGISEEDRRILQAHSMRVGQMLRMMQPEFQISQSYFISHEYLHLFADVPMVGGGKVEDHQPGDWHPDDMLMVPLFSPRQRKLLGFISLDDPVDGRVPTEESIEMIELFANQAAAAIDNARLFQERETERQCLERAIVDLRRDMERVQRGDLRVRMQSLHEKLKPVAEAINLMLDEISGVLGTVQMVTQAVDEHTHEVQHHSNLLVKDTSQQERQVQHISLAIGEMGSIMQRVSESAARISNVSTEAVDVNREGQHQVARAIEGMRQVREVTMQSSRVMKRLGESGQEINDTVGEISDLTGRMNLLALNAAIEAVRAGDQGQGFVMIAQEIRSLAVHSAEAVRQVSTRLRTIQQETATVAGSVEQNIQQVVMQSELVSETGAALEAMNIVTAQMSNLVEDICAAAESQAQGSRRVSYAVEEISRMTSEITRHMLEMQQSLAHLVELTNLLRTRMSVFRIADEQ